MNLAFDLIVQKEITKHKHTRVLSCKLNKYITFELGQKTLAVAPLQLKDIKADKILQVHQNDHQRVQLIGEPEVCKLHPVERCREDAELEPEQEVRQGKRKNCLVHSGKMEPDLGNSS